MMIKIITTLVLSVQLALADDINASVWTSDADSITVSREAVSIPSVYILDDITVHFQTLDKNIGSIKLTKNEIIALNKVGDLNPELEPFFEKCNLYVIITSNNDSFLIYDEIDTDRYGYAKAVKNGKQFLQRGDLQMCTLKKLPKELISILSKTRK
jgi:hypothetical protein